MTGGMEISKAIQEGVEQLQANQALREQMSARTEGTIPGPTEGTEAGRLSPEQDEINKALLPDENPVQQEIDSAPVSDITRDEHSLHLAESDDVGPAKPESDSLVRRDDQAPAEVRNDDTYSKDVSEQIRSKEELDLYKSLGLEEDDVNGRPTLKNPSIDGSATDEKGRTNVERMREGKPPIGEDGRPIELHHIGQKSDSPLAELSSSDHRSNKGILHDSQPSEVDHGSSWQKEAAEHWKARAKDFEAGN